MNPQIIEAILKGVEHELIIDNCPLDSFVLVRVSVCPCHGPNGVVAFAPLNHCKAFERFRADRTATSLPIVVVDETGKIIHVKTLRWDDPRPKQVGAEVPEIAKPKSLRPLGPMPVINSRGGVA